MKKVVIILSTYNGHKYLREQIDSLLKQTYKNIVINVRDDGSKDDTLDILKEYEKEGKIKIISSHTNLGVIDSYKELLKHCTKGDYYAFCDQDDIWKENKITLAVQALSKINDDNVPVLYASNYEIYDSSGHYVSESGLGEKIPSFPKALMETLAPGMTMVFNETMRKMLVSTLSPKCVLHDGWATLIASGLGKVYYDSTSTVCYRRHDASVTSSSSTLFGQFKELLGKEHWSNLKMILTYFEECYGSSLKEKDLKLLKLFTSKKTFIRQLKKAFYLGRYKDNVIKDILFRIVFLLYYI